jgi:Lon protease-like protein
MSSADFSHQPRAQWQRLPIFPLAQVQLFPHALLPLHVFEPRYRELVRDALAGERLIAMASLEPGYEDDYHGRPPVRAIIGVGQMIGHEALPDGRSHILLRGLARARIERELPVERSYRLVEAATLADELGSAAQCAAARDTLVVDVVQRIDRVAAEIASVLARLTAPGPAN